MNRSKKHISILLSVLMILQMLFGTIGFAASGGSDKGEREESTRITIETPFKLTINKTYEGGYHYTSTADFQIMDKDTGNYLYVSGNPGNYVVSMTSRDRTLSVKDGTIYLENIPEGNYVIKEVAADSDYSLADDTEFSVGPEASHAQVTIDNTLRVARVYIMSLDKDYEMLPNTTFNILNSKGETMKVKPLEGEDDMYVVSEDGSADITTDKDGHIWVDKLPLGSYEIYETINPKGYIPDEKITTFELPHGFSTPEIGIFHSRIAEPEYDTKLIIHVKDEYLNAYDPTLPAKFVLEPLNGENAIEINGSNGHYVYSKGSGKTELTIDNNSNLTITGLPNGKYRLRNIEIDPKYVSNEITVTIPENGEVSEDYITRIATGSTDITSFDEQYNQLPGSSFYVLDSKGNKVKATYEDSYWGGKAYTFDPENGVDIFNVNDEGMAMLADFPIGTYTLVETNAPTGYKKVTNMEFEIYEGEPGYVDLVHEKAAYCTLLVKEVDDKSNTLLKDANFGIRIKDTVGGVYRFEGVEILHPDENGIITVPDQLLEGDYIIEQVGAATGYYFNENKEFPITIVDKGEEPNVLTIRETMPQMGKLLISKTSNFISTFKTKEITLLGEKFNVLDNIAEENHLAGAVIEVTAADTIYNADGSIAFNKNDVVERYTSDGTVKEIEVPLGAYNILEIEAPDGYLATHEFITHDFLAEEIPSNVQTIEKEIKIINPKLDYIVNVTKEFEESLQNFDTENTTIFGLYNNEDIQIAENQTIPANTLVDVAVVENGECSLTAPLNSSYTVKELKTHDAYKLADDVIINFNTRAEAPSNYQYIVIVNDLIRDKIKINKVNQEQEPLAGVQFLISLKNGEESTEIETATTNKSGFIAINDLEKGVYQIQELKTLDGYILDKNVYELDLTQEGPREITITNFKEKTYKTTISRLCSNDNTPVIGAMLTLKDSETSEVIAKWTSGEEPKEFTDLVTGKTYYVEETFTPPGYKKLSTSAFTVEENKDTEVLLKSAKTRLTITRLDDNNAMIDGSKVTVYIEDKVSEHVVTDGKIVLEGVHGRILVSEIVAPDGYKKAVSQITKIVNDDKEITLSSEKTKLLIKRTDLTGALVNGSIINVLDEDNNIVYTTEESGNNFIVEGLIAGKTYTLVETKHPEGYKVPEQETVTISSEKDSTVFVKSGKIVSKIYKVDENNNPLQGASFTIKDSENKTITFTAETPKPPAVQKTFNVKVVWPDYPDGDHPEIENIYFNFMSQKPDNGWATMEKVYITDEHTLNIDEKYNGRDEYTVTLVGENDKLAELGEFKVGYSDVQKSDDGLHFSRTIYIRRTDTPQTGGGPIIPDKINEPDPEPDTIDDVPKYEGAYHVYNGEGAVSELAVNENGEIVIVGLPTGTYTIEEIVVPNGYVKASNQTLNAENDKDNMITIINSLEPKPDPEPETEITFTVKTIWNRFEEDEKPTNLELAWLSKEDNGEFVEDSNSIIDPNTDSVISIKENLLLNKSFDAIVKNVNEEEMTVEYGEVIRNDSGNLEKIITFTKKVVEEPEPEPAIQKTFEVKVIWEDYPEGNHPEVENIYFNFVNIKDNQSTTMTKIALQDEYILNIDEQYNDGYDFTVTLTDNDENELTIDGHTINYEDVVKSEDGLHYSRVIRIKKVEDSGDVDPEEPIDPEEPETPVVDPEQPTDPDEEPETPVIDPENPDIEEPETPSEPTDPDNNQEELVRHIYIDLVTSGFEEGENIPKIYIKYLIAEENADSWYQYGSIQEVLMNNKVIIDSNHNSGYEFSFVVCDEDMNVIDPGLISDDIRIDVEDLQAKDNDFYGKIFISKIVEEQKPDPETPSEPKDPETPDEETPTEPVKPDQPNKEEPQEPSVPDKVQPKPVTPNVPNEDTVDDTKQDIQVTEPQTSPKTGVTQQASLYIMLMLISIGSLVLIRKIQYNKN